MPLDLNDDKSTLVQVMAWCRQATSHYLRQCWPRSMSPNGVTKPQWFNSLSPMRYGCDYQCVIEFQTQLGDWYLEYSNIHHWGMNATWSCWWQDNIGSGNGLVLSGNKPLPDPMFTKISWRHMVLQGHIELTDPMLTFLSFGPSQTNFSEMWNIIWNFSLDKMHLEISLQNVDHLIKP